MTQKRHNAESTFTVFCMVVSSFGKEVLISRSWPTCNTPMSTQSVVYAIRYTRAVLKVSDFPTITTTVTTAGVFSIKQRPFLVWYSTCNGSRVARQYGVYLSQGR